MKKLIVASAVAGVLIFGAIAAVAIGSSSTAVAQSDTAQTEAPATTDTEVPEWVDQVLDGLVTGGILTQDTADQLRAEAPFLIGMLDQMKLDFDTDSDEPGTEGHLPFDIERFKDQFDGLEFPEGFDFFGPDFFGPDGFNFQDLRDQFENFDFDSFEIPEGFDHPEGVNPESFGEFRFPGGGFGFLDGISGLSFDDLRDAMQNGTLTDLIDVDSIMSDVTARIEQAVTAGDLTRDQADRMLEKLTKNYDAIANGELPFFGHGSENPRPQSGADSEQGA